MEPRLNPENNPTADAALEPPADVTTEAAPSAVAAEPETVAETAALELPAALEPEPSPNGLPAVPVSQTAEVLERLDRFEAQLAEHLRVSAACSRAAFDHLYEEMQAYKKNFLREAQRPLLLDLMMLYDSIDKLRRNYEQMPAPEPAALCQNLDALQVEAEEILGRVGIERMSVTPEKLDVNLQRAIKTIPTDDPEEHLRVVQQVSAGFMSDGRPLRKEQVVVKKHTPGAAGTSV